jgi:hypothetical protein
MKCEVSKEEKNTFFPAPILLPRIFVDVTLFHSSMGVFTCLGFQAASDDDDANIFCFSLYLSLSLVKGRERA